MISKKKTSAPGRPGETGQRPAGGRYGQVPGRDGGSGRRNRQLAAQRRRALAKHYRAKYLPGHRGRS